MADRARIEARLEALWQIARGPGGGADRPAYSPAEAEAMRLVAGWAAQLGLEPGLDDHGNLWALPAGDADNLITSGSHVDTVPDGGRYDGALGTVLGLEAVEDLRERLPSGVEPGLLVCAAEEAPRFGAGTIGSRLLVGSLTPEALGEVRDRTGVTAAEALAGHLERLAELPRITPPLDRLRAHGEVHVATRRTIRQLGIVTRVAAPQRSMITITGAAGHAGEVAMDERRDALAAGAALMIGIERAARAEPVDTVATIGTLEVVPGAVSVIPGRVRLGLDTRSTDLARLQALDEEIRRVAAQVAAERGVSIEVERVRAGHPVEMEPMLVAAALEAAGRRGIRAARTWSGSGHDSQHVASVAPALLMFIPLHGGESHTPQEGADLGEALDAAAVLADALATAA